MHIVNAHCMNGIKLIIICLDEKLMGIQLYHHKKEGPLNFFFEEMSHFVMTSIKEGFKDLTFKCDHHGLNRWQLLKCFYDGLNGDAKRKIDRACGGSYLDKDDVE